jgi:hypothetical protein
MRVSSPSLAPALSGSLRGSRRWPLAPSDHHSPQLPPQSTVGPLHHPHLPSQHRLRDGRDLPHPAHPRTLDPRVHHLDDHVGGSPVAGGPPARVVAELGRWCTVDGRRPRRMGKSRPILDGGRAMARTGQWSSVTRPSRRRSPAGLGRYGRFTGAPSASWLACISIY